MRKDILILGGGPAGLSTALHLARRAPSLVARVLVLEKAHYPRPKLCGGGLTGDAEVILQGLDLDVAEVPHVDVSEAHLDFVGQGLVIPRGKSHALRIIRRDEFDAWLAAKTRQAGIEIREGVAARRLTAAVDDVRVETDDATYEAAIVVGADGSNGITRRCILPHAPIHTARALEVLFPPAPAGEAAPSPASQPGHADDVAYFDFAPVPSGIAGYTWDFPTQVDGQRVRCWGIYDTNLLARQVRPPLRLALADEMERHGASLEHVELQGHPIRWFSPFSGLSIPRVILVGDAAGADGIFGEGISIALGYGRIAAAAILDALARNDFSFRSYRSSVLRSPLGRALSARTLITHILYRLHWTWFQWFFWRLFKPVVAAVSFVAVLNWAKRMK